MVKIYFIRHAHSDYVPGKELERPLSQEGALASQDLVALFEGINIDQAYSSDYYRALETIRPICQAKSLNIHQSQSLRERKLHDGFLDQEDFLKEVERTYDDHDYKLEGGESINDAKKRALPYIKGILEDHDGESIILGSHGNIMTIILNAFDETYDYKFWSQLKMPDVYEATFENNQLTACRRRL